MAQQDIPPKFGVAFLPGPPAEFSAWCLEAEVLGFDLVGIPDSQSVYRENIVSSTLAAAHTRRVRFGPMVINPITRHPAVAASAIATLAELAPGRVILGIGTGDSAVHNLGLRPAKLAELREYVTTIRQLLLRGESVYQGNPVRITWKPPYVPIYIAAIGPRTMELAGEIADGVIILNGLLPENIKASLTHIGVGAASAGRRVEDLDLWWWTSAAVADSRTAAIESLMMSLASGAKHLAQVTTDGKQIPSELEPTFHEVMGRYRFDQHQVPGGANVRLIEELGLVDYLAERMAIAGSPDDCKAQIARAQKAGAYQFCLLVAFANKIGFMRRWSESVVADLS
ncbi:MAG: LLM class flavin-dependent oxidoreductase [Alphaproteobacteria bacterium]